MSALRKSPGSRLWYVACLAMIDTTERLLRSTEGDLPSLIRCNSNPVRASSHAGEGSTFGVVSKDGLPRRARGSKR